MTERSSDWRFVTRGMVVPAATFLLAVVLLAASLLYQSRLEAQYRRMTVDHGAVNSEYEAFVVRKRLLERYHRRYEVLRDSGFVATERRIDLLEVLREAGEDIGLPALRYTLEPQLEMVPPAAIPDGTLTLHASRLQLEVALVHEIDLLKLLESLRSRAPGLLSVDGCALVRLGDGSAPSAFDPNITVSCSLRVFSAATSDVPLEVAAL